MALSHIFAVYVTVIMGCNRQCPQSLTQFNGIQSGSLAVPNIPGAPSSLSPNRPADQIPRVPGEMQDKGQSKLTWSKQVLYTHHASVMLMILSCMQVANQK